MSEKIFDKWAESYDTELNLHKKEFPFLGYHDVLEWILQSVDVSKGMKILDVGVGTGNLSHILSNKGCSLYGVDCSSKMLAVAKEKIPKGNFELVDVSCKHFGKYNYEKFDRVVSNYFFHHLSTFEKIVFFERTIKNNLNPGGRIIIGDIGFKTKEEFEKARILYSDNWDDDEFYLIGEELTRELSKAGIFVEYIQVAESGGILFYE